MSVSLAKAPSVPASEAEGYVIIDAGDRLNVQRAHPAKGRPGATWFFAAVLDTADFTVGFRSNVVPSGQAFTLSDSQLVPAEDWELV